MISASEFINIVHGPAGYGTWAGSSYGTGFSSIWVHRLQWRAGSPYAILQLWWQGEEAEVAGSWCLPKLACSAPTPQKVVNSWNNSLQLELNYVKTKNKGNWF